MAFSQRTFPVLLVAAALVVGLAACSGNSAAGAGGGSGSGSKSGGGSGTTSASSATFSGSESGTVTISTCAADGAGLYVVVKGSSDKLSGAISKSTMDFNGSDSIYTIDKTGPLPQVSTDGNTFTLDGVTLKSVLDPTKEVTFAGKLTCP
jgi:hypothetical protein